MRRPALYKKRHKLPNASEQGPLENDDRAKNEVFAAIHFILDSGFATHHLTPKHICVLPPS